MDKAPPPQISLKRKICFHHDTYTRAISSIVMFSIVALSMYFEYMGLWALLVCVSFLSCFEWFGLWATTHNHSNPWTLKILALGYVYLLFSLYCLGTLGLTMPMHFLHVASTVWITDIFSYFIGTQFKFLELYMSIYFGQGKTWPGLVGGIVFGTILPFILFMEISSTYNLSKNIMSLFLKTFALSIFSQFGDLIESYIKRQACKKDSSTFIFHIPGHGGILDRIDSLLFASCLGYIYKNY